MEEESVAEFLARMLKPPKRDIGLKIERELGSRYARIIIGESYIKELRETFELVRPNIEAERGHPVAFEYLLLETLVEYEARMRKAVALLKIIKCLKG